MKPQARCHICRKKGQRKKMYCCDHDSDGNLTPKDYWVHRRCMVKWNRLATVFEEEWGSIGGR